MHSENISILIGNLGKDPQLTYTTSGVACCKFSVATNETWKDKAGVKQERTDFHNITVWAKQAELCSEYLKKGDPVFIKGSMHTDEYNDNEGNKKYFTYIKAQNVNFLPRRNKDGQAQDVPQPQGGDQHDDLPF